MAILTIIDDEKIDENLHSPFTNSIKYQNSILTKYARSDGHRGHDARPCVADFEKSQA